MRIDNDVYAELVRKYEKLLSLARMLIDDNVHHYSYEAKKVLDEIGETDELC